MTRLFWIGLWSLIKLSEANVLPNCLVAKEESLLPSANKTMFGRGQDLRGGDFNMSKLNTAVLPTLFLNISHHISSEHERILDFIICVLRDHILARFIISTFMVELFGNIMIFFFLLFHFKKNSWTAYIWNLAVADFGVLTFLCSVCLVAFINYICEDSSDAFVKLFLPLAYLFFFMQCSSMHFLVAISIDWCLAVICPSWHKRHQPDILSPVISAILSVLLWPLTCQLLWLFSLGIDTRTLIVISLMVFVPLMVISNQTLVIKIWCSLHQKGKLHTEILLGTLFSLVTWVPIQKVYYEQPVVLQGGNP
ncbi:mas-related G-protein coupled receptor member A6-like [Elgaria multicarinata webbii]|uniref:mas-related G-protein coupled receptor member A6-like n=1 Tax=Elgaria multicarinata webbii TaxID=159646 RepID=UPI002FCD6989